MLEVHKCHFIKLCFQLWNMTATSMLFYFSSEDIKMCLYNSTKHVLFTFCWNIYEIMDSPNLVLQSILKGLPYPWTHFSSASTGLEFTDAALLLWVCIHRSIIQCRVHDTSLHRLIKEAGCLILTSCPGHHCHYYWFNLFQKKSSDYCPNEYG